MSCTRKASIVHTRKVSVLSYDLGPTAPSQQKEITYITKNESSINVLIQLYCTFLLINYEIFSFPAFVAICLRIFAKNIWRRNSSAEFFRGIEQKLANIQHVWFHAA